ncbi:MAG: outer membrane beta-barrel protein [Bacteroidota bacterium]|nr:outer membrane beta-barrel protein [Bacteroidota bacterium]MDX5448903.1 outer membrane beta-barrel protein [Bacteroidota bacterium]MDX5504572.1 outer membrane beta-barrel protein [Bacteroidota bacterium]
MKKVLLSLALVGAGFAASAQSFSFGAKLNNNLFFFDESQGGANYGIGLLVSGQYALNRDETFKLGLETGYMSGSKADFSTTVPFGFNGETITFSGYSKFGYVPLRATAGYYFVQRRSPFTPYVQAGIGVAFGSTKSHMDGIDQIPGFPPGYSFPEMDGKEGWTGFNFVPRLGFNYNMGGSADLDVYLGGNLLSVTQVATTTDTQSGTTTTEKSTSTEFALQFGVGINFGTGGGRRR